MADVFSVGTSTLQGMLTGASTTLDPAADELARETRARTIRRPSEREWLTSIALAVVFVVGSIAAARWIDDGQSLTLGTAALLIVAYAIASHVEFEIGAGSAIPTELMLVPMLFLLPLAYVPLAVATALLLGALLDHVQGGAPLERAVAGVPVGAMHVFGPVLVLAAAGVTEPRLDEMPIYAAALAAQFIVDFTVSAGREWVVLGISPLKLVRYMAWVYAVDFALAAVGLAVAHAAYDDTGGVLLALPLVALLAFFARERQTRIDHALDLSTAYRGTAFLLGDVIEADDHYTGSHSRDVVELSVSVADQLALDSIRRQRVELAALLHDVGKIRIANEIINKPGPLDLAEWAIIETHPIEGERMLENVGGLLADVGHIVRSCHERWDGNGYPDGLAGEAIPLEARIVCVCDAFNAMTTQRSYRPARTTQEALAELRSCAGTQFDPRITTAFETVLSQR